MKKLLTLALAVVFIATLATVVAANPDAGYSITASRGTPVVDGVKDDIWDSAEVQTQDRIRNGTDTGTHVAIRFLYDDDNLYLLAEVPDSSIWTKDLSLASMTYNMDGAEICLSLTNSSATSIDTATDAWVGVTPYADFYSSQANWLVGSGSGVSTDNEEFDAEFMEVHTSLENDPDNETANPYYIEAVWHIKAYDAQYAPADGVKYGFEISYNDNAEYNNRTMCIGWSDISDAASSNPSVWGEIVLGGEGAAAEPVEYKAVGEVSVPYATPTIDGVISEGEYPEIGKVVLNQSNLTSLGWVGEVPAENSIDLYYAWDKDNFYLAGNVTDPAFAYSDIGQYNMDAFQVSLNIANVFKTDEGYDRAIFYSWGLQEEGTIDVIRQESANNDTIFEVGKGQKTDTGWCFEVPLSLEMLAEDAYLKGGEEAIPEPGMPIGGLFCYLDHDEAGSLVNAFGTSTDEVMGWDPDAHGITFMFAEKSDAAADADPNAPAILWDFNSDGAMDANMGANSGANAVSWTADKDDAGNEYYTFTASGADPYVSVDLSAADVSDVVWAKARVKNAGPATAIELFGHTNDRGLTGSECTHINVGTDGEWHTYIIYIPDENVTTVNAYKDPQYAITEPYWEGTVDWIRLDPMWQEGDDGNDAGGSMNDGDQIMIDYIAFFSSEEAAKAFRSEQDSEYVPSSGFATVEEAADGKNVVTAYEFVSGTNGFGSEGPENLWDGNTGTKFCTNEFPAESIVKLDGVYNVTGFTMATANDNKDYNGRSPNAWTVSVSADGENWTELAKGDDSFFEETNFTYYVGDAAAEGVSYVKFNAEGTASGTFQVSELTLFGDKTEEVVAPVDETMDQKAESPNTFDFGITAAVAAVISLAGFAAAKKKH